ncbi:hypothetical protein Bbelb_338300 [Branchiostoma belcheri]|nr:hypothetical protein Bbelb_338300 [Branchiostoma belcheri]
MSDPHAEKGEPPSVHPCNEVTNSLTTCLVVLITGPVSLLGPEVISKQILRLSELMDEKGHQYCPAALLIPRGGLFTQAGQLEGPDAPCSLRTAPKSNGRLNRPPRALPSLSPPFVRR